jgi:hypothetical protein
MSLGVSLGRSSDGSIVREDDDYMVTSEDRRIIVIINHDHHLTVDLLARERELQESPCVVAECLSCDKFR